ncbi:uncharacterized protein LOC123514035 isoform X2 [Portunus trituberculatus]|uniref:uncharacterized protein LOC123514035 isoform X2 n=1 Tax=Portunus trituberculatus TaxID=210409 RepID=UPI001E1CF6A7|nr:uncharacterized protein LOC123514035 isoform X2 [Portunus trituberculatus]
MPGCLPVAAGVLMMMMVVAASSISSEDDKVWEVTGVAGRSVDLPCYLRPRTPGDRPKLVLWYKEAHSSPLVSHDTRNGLPPGDSALDLSVGLGRGRGEGALRVGRGSATLTYYNVTPEHAGLYECRVDFYTSPANTNYVNLTVVELPKKVRLVDKEGLSIEEDVLGPYFTGQTVRVECVALGGQPRPKLTWWRNNHILRSGGEEEDGPGRVRSELVIQSISRAWHNHTLACTASNTPLASPVPASATITLYLLPRRVEVQTPGHAKEGQPALILCTTEGSRPRPTLTLSLGGRRLTQDKERVEGLVSVATVSVNVTRADHGAVVACTAENPAVPGSSLTNTTLLDVEYPPSVTASLGRSLKPHLLKEGDDVYFTCSVDANPPAAAVTWYHEGRVQVQNMTSGVILTGESLVLQKVSRRRAGEYRCQATNSFASVTSSPVTLRIRYRPQCLTTPTTYFIYDKPINVTCTVTSHPPAKAVHWQWNSSNDVIKTQLVEATTERVSTQLSVAPIETYEDRLLSCWAVNEMGRQQRACGFSIKVAEMPLPLSSCGLANITASSLSLTCQRPPLAVPGSSTVYRAEVYLENRTLLANVTSMSPNFNVSHLDAGTNYQIKVYVTHGPVTSPPVVVSAYTSRTPPETSGDSNDQDFVEMRGDSGNSDVGNVEQGVMEKGAVESSSGNSDGNKDSRGGRRGRLGGGDGKTEVGAVMAAVVAVAVLATMGGVWAWRRRWRWQGGGSVSAAARGPAGVRSGAKDSGAASSSSSSGNPDVVPTLGSSFSKRSSSPRHFWNKDKAVEASGGGSTGRLPTLNENSSLGDTTAGGSGSGGAESSPCDSQRNSGACSTSTPTLSQKTVCSGDNSSPAESSRALGGDSSSSLTSSLKTVCSVGTSTPTDGMKSRDSTSSPSQSPATVGRGLSSGGGGSSSSNSSRRTAVITYRPSPPSGGPCRRTTMGRGGGQRPMSAVADLGVGSLRKSFLLNGEEEEEDYHGKASPEERIRRRRHTLAEEEEAAEERRRRRRAAGVRFSFTPGEMAEEDGLGVAYHGAKGSYLLRELKGYPGTLPRRAPRDALPQPPRGHFGSREVLDLSGSDRGSGEFVPYPRPLYSSRDVFGGSGVRLREDSYAEFYPHGHREAPGRAGVRVQLSGRAQLHRGSRHSLGHGASVGELRSAGSIQRRGSWASLHYPVDQLIKAAETVV